MSDQKIDKGKGRVKEAAGAITGDIDLKNRGRADQAKGEVKKALDKVSDAVAGNKRAR